MISRSYLHDICMDAELRHELLSSSFNFNCSCNRCTMEMFLMKTEKNTNKNNNNSLNFSNYKNAHKNQLLCELYSNLSEIVAHQNLQRYKMYFKFTHMKTF